MEVTINRLSGVQEEAEIEVSHSELQPLFEQAYEKYRQKVEIRGFRKGKAPLDMIKKMYGSAIEHESLDDAADAFYKQAMQERNIHPIGQPKLVDMDFKPGQTFRFKINYEVRPVFALGEYKGVAVEKVIHRVTDEEIAAEIDYLRRANSTTEEVQGVTDEDHIVTADVQELDAADMPLIGRKSSGVRFNLFDQTLPEGIRKAIASAAVGGRYRATVESHGEDGRHATHVAISPSKIEKVTLPQFDADLVTKMTQGKVTTTEEFTASLRTDLERYWNDLAERKVRDGIADEIVRTHDFEVPESLVNTFLDAFLEDVKNRQRGKQLPVDFNIERFRNEGRPTAIWQSKWMLLKQAIAEAEKIEVTDDDLDALATAESARAKVDKDRVLQYYRNSGSATERLLSERIMSFLRSHARVREVEERQQDESLKPIERLTANTK